MEEELLKEMNRSLNKIRDVQIGIASLMRDLVFEVREIKLDLRKKENGEHSRQ